jgi:hypothetical protein
MAKMGHEPAPPTGRVLMWKMRDRNGLSWFGVTRDGLVFYRLAGDQEPVFQAPVTDVPDEMADALLLKLAEKVEQRGGALLAGPVEFGIDVRLLERLRKNALDRYDDNTLLMAFDMATGR